MSSRIVLDAWAIIALLQGEEPAAARVNQLLKQASSQETLLHISIINLGEVLYRVGKTRGETQAWETLEQLRQLPIEIVQATEENVLAAATFKMRHPVSYADAFAAAIALQYDATLATGDPELLRLRALLPIEKLERGG